MTKDEAKLLKVDDVVEFYFQNNGDTKIGLGEVVENTTRTIFSRPVIVVKSKLIRQNWYFGVRTDDTIINNHITVLKPKNIIRKV